MRRLVLRAMKCIPLLAAVLLLLAGPVKAQAAPIFFYVVSSVDANGFESVFSNQVTVTFNQGQSKATLTWTASTVPVGGAAISNYKVYRSKTSGGSYALINTVPATSVSYLDSFVLPNAPSGLAATAN